MTGNLASVPKRGRPSRREPIFASALRLFRERGFHATAINEIGADADVTGPAIYSHFESKGELLAEAIRIDALNGRLHGRVSVERIPVDPRRRHHRHDIGPLRQKRGGRRPALAPQHQRPEDAHDHQ